jgi:death-on-curing protein
MYYITKEDILELHTHIITQTGGIQGIRDAGALESAIAQPQITFDDQDLYPTLIEKAAALGFSLINDHPFLDGNKRVGHAAMEVFLVLNGYEIDASTDEQEEIILGVAAGDISKTAFIEWLRSHIISYISL